MSSHKSSLADYIGWLFKQFQDLKSHTPASVYRVVDVQEKDEKYVITIQIVGKATTFTAFPEEILADDKLVEYFSSKDIRTITYYATRSLTKPKNKIVIKKFCEKLNKVVFGVKHIDEDDVYEKTAEEISLDKNLLNGLTPEEAHMVGYTTAQHRDHNEKEEIQKLRKNKKSSLDKIGENIE
ncbi:MAG: uncharacterized protein K0S08_2124 [Gammaproteobacteria bacterium]|jgi:ribosomal protein L33|nr:uncharacterized protein [Gammaproteobacteria bacterium]